MARKIGFRNFISIDGAPPVPMESLTPEQREYVSCKWAENLSRTMSAYYSQHLDEYEKLLASQKQAT